MTIPTSAPRPSPAVPSLVAIPARNGFEPGLAVDSALGRGLPCAVPVSRWAADVVLVPVDGGVPFVTSLGGAFGLGAFVAFDPPAVGSCSTYCAIAGSLGGGEANAPGFDAAPTIAAPQTSNPHRLASFLI